MLDLSAGTMAVPGVLAKNRRDHRIYLTPTDVALLREQLPAAGGHGARLSDARGQPMDGEQVPRAGLAAGDGSGGRREREQTGQESSIFEGFALHLTLKLLQTGGRP